LEYIATLENITFEIVFITAYSAYAIKAFRLNAIDYLLKPIIEEDFCDAVNKTLAKIGLTNQTYNQIGIKQLQLLNTNEQKNINTIVLNDKLNHALVNFNAIVYLESQYGTTVFYYEVENKGVVKFTTGYILSHYEEVLPADLFCRIHKKYIINIRKIEKVDIVNKMEVSMIKNIQIPIGRRRVKDLTTIISKVNN
jgi:two-component system LytT family response regulator